MAQQNINIGSSANKGDGDPIRVAFTKVNANFTDLFARVVVLEGGGIAVAQDIQGDIFAQDSSLGYSSATNTHYGSFVGALDGDVTGSVFADNSTVIIDGVAGTVSAGALTGNLPALDGSNLTNLTIPAQTFTSLTSKPTTLAGYGITDAQALLVSATNIKTINGATVLGSGDLTVTGSSDDTLQDYKANVSVTATDVYGNPGDGYTDIAITISDTSHERFTLSGANGTAVDLPDCGDAQFGKKVYIRTPGTGVAATVHVDYTNSTGATTTQSFSVNAPSSRRLFTWYGSYWQQEQVI